MSRRFKHSFGLVPEIRKSRSRFDLSHGNKTSFNVGDLVPIDIQEVLPGDSFTAKTNAVVRVTSSFIKPIVDNLFMDIHHFFVPLRLVYDKAQDIFGSSSPSAYITENENAAPVIPKATDDGGVGGLNIASGTVGDYLGLPINENGTRTTPFGISVLPFRAFALIYNEWFRNENVTDEIYVQRGEWADNEYPNEEEWSPTNYMGKLPKVSKVKDYFTSCLPAPQKGIAPALPIFGGDIPVYAKNENVPGGTVGDSFDYARDGYLPDGSQNTVGLTLGARNLQNIDGVNSYNVFVPQGSSASGIHLSIYDDELYHGGDGFGNVRPINLWAMPGAISNQQGATVNDFRYVFQLQKMLERDARSGGRYNEYLLGSFGVVSPDARLQFTEYLGGGRVPIQIQQTVQTSASTDDSPLANVSGYSLTNGRSKYSKGFVEHGYVITVACIKQLHTYQQGINKLFYRQNRTDFYDPVFANIGEQPVYKNELRANATSFGLKDGAEVFGYNEAWAEYRYRASQVTGQMRTKATNSLDVWHLADYYDGDVYLNKAFIEENTANIDRVVSVPSYTEDGLVKGLDNFLVDFWFDISAVRVMPVYSVPGLIDHH